MFLSAGESHALQEVSPHRGSTCWLWGQAVRCPLWTPIDHHCCHLDPMGASHPRLLGMCRPFSPLITGQSACHSLSQHLHWFPSHSSPLCRSHMVHPGPPWPHFPPAWLSFLLLLPPPSFPATPPTHSHSHTPMTQLHSLLCLLSVSH